jgi:hypothetical protein
MGWIIFALEESPQYGFQLHSMGSRSHPVYRKTFFSAFYKTIDKPIDPNKEFFQIRNHKLPELLVHGDEIFDIHEHNACIQLPLSFPMSWGWMIKYVLLHGL